MFRKRDLCRGVFVWPTRRCRAAQFLSRTSSSHPRITMEVIGSRYQVGQTIRRGSANFTLRGRDLQHDRDVALKVHLISAGVSRTDLLAEARTLLGLRPHPGLPTVRDDFFLDDRYVIVL